jgi:hypothetical protein
MRNSPTKHRKSIRKRRSVHTGAPKLAGAPGAASGVCIELSDRLDLPIAFIHGAESHCFLPVSTERTYDLLFSGEVLYIWYRVPGVLCEGVNYPERHGLLTIAPTNVPNCYSARDSRDSLNAFSMDLEGLVDRFPRKG